jgi:hypothetical protein
MGLFKDFVEGVATGFLSANGHTSPPAHSHKGTSRELVEAICTQLGWTIDGRIGNDGIILHFNDPLVRVRKVIISCGEAGYLIGFFAGSAAILPAAQVPAAVLAYLLQRNAEMATMAWQLSARDHGNVSFGLAYCALAEGLTAGMFKVICENIVQEAHGFDAKMQAAGAL